jgi:hypothetical protein
VCDFPPVLYTHCDKYKKTIAPPQSGHLPSGGPLPVPPNPSFYNPHSLGFSQRNGDDPRKPKPARPGGTSRPPSRSEPNPGSVTMQSDLVEILRELRFDALDRSRLIFLEQIAGRDEIGGLLARHLDIAGALAIAALKLVN